MQSLWKRLCGRGGVLGRRPFQPGFEEGGRVGVLPEAGGRGFLSVKIQVDIRDDLKNKWQEGHLPAGVGAAVGGGSAAVVLGAVAVALAVAAPVGCGGCGRRRDLVALVGERVLLHVAL